jgi:hypothetical protein
MAHKDYIPGEVCGGVKSEYPSGSRKNIVL